MKMKLLLAEDHDSNRAVLRRRLERKGFDVLEAENGAVAVERFEDFRPDVVLLDISMPVMDGLEARRAMADLGHAAEVKFIALTAHAMVEMREKCLAAGFDMFITKPIEFEELIDAIEGLRGRHAHCAS